MVGAGKTRRICGVMVGLAANSARQPGFDSQRVHREGSSRVHSTGHQQQVGTELR